MRKRDLARALAEEVRYRMWVEHRMYVAENALERAHDHLRFHAWKGDPNSDKRFEAVQEVEEVRQQTAARTSHD